MSNTPRILVIDDEKNYLMVMQALLTDAGYEVTALNDPEMALHFLDESEVDVVITMGKSLIGFRCAPMERVRIGFIGEQTMAYAFPWCYSSL